MYGLDGNYLKMQGDALAKMQVVFQSEQNRKQILTQLESMEHLRKIREQVQESEKSNSNHLSLIQDEDQSSHQQFNGEEGYYEGDKNIKNEESNFVKSSKNHIDIKV